MSPLGPPKGMTVAFVLEASLSRGHLGYHCALTTVSARRSSFLFSGLAKESLAAELQADECGLEKSPDPVCSIFSLTVCRCKQAYITAADREHGEDASVVASLRGQPD